MSLLKIKTVLFSLAVLFMIAGCKKNGPEIILTKGLTKEDVFMINEKICTKTEFLVWLANLENGYGDTFGNDLFNVTIDENSTVGEKYKDAVLAKLSQIKAMSLMSKSQGIVLTDDEKNNIKSAAAEYYATLTDIDKISMNGVKQNTIETIYTDLYLANKVYEKLTQSVNPEISDDEARSVSIKAILIKTYKIDELGNHIKYNSDEMNDAYRRAFDIYTKLQEGESFDILAADYNEDDKVLYSFGRGEMPEAIEEAAYNLSEGEVSSIIETEYGYHIIKCISNFDSEQTDISKSAIVETRREEAFTEEYSRFASTLAIELNEDVYNNITYIRANGCDSISLLEIYKKYCET